MSLEDAKLVERLERQLREEYNKINAENIIISRAMARRSIHERQIDLLKVLLDEADTLTNTPDM